MELRDLYVALSRVRKRAHIRLLGVEQRSSTKYDRLKHSLELTPCPDLIDWNKNFTETGEWKNN